MNEDLDSNSVVSNYKRKRYQAIEEYKEIDSPDLTEWHEFNIGGIIHLECYSENFINGLNNIWKAVKEYLHTQDIETTTNKYNFDKKKLMSIARNIIDNTDLIKAYFNSFGFRDELGLEYAKGRILIFHKENDRIPTSSDTGMFGISAAIQNRYWEEIKSFTEIIKSTTTITETLVYG